MNSESVIVPRKYLPIFVMLSSCFALWGLLNNMTDNLVPSFQKIFMTSQSTAGFVQISFYGAYSVIALLASLLIQKKGYRVGVLVGLGVYCMGALLYVPAAIAQSFWTFIVGIFVVAGGCAVLETTCNPYVLALGDESTAVRRLNFAQMFNPVGSFMGIFLAQQLILANLNPATVAERRVLPPDALNAIVHHELFWVCVPYVAVCAVAAAIWVFFFASKPTEIDRARVERTNVRDVLAILVHSPRWYCGVIAQVFYVGVQIAAWTWTNVYCRKELGVDEATAAYYYLIAFSLFMVCRWICTGLMKWFEPAKMMAVFAVGAILSSFGVMYLPSDIVFRVGSLPFSWNVISLCAMSGFMSLMFPTIYGIGLGGIDPRAHKLGAAGLIMAIVGGALLTPWMAAIIDRPGIWANLVPMFDATVDPNLHASSLSLRASFIVPVICFAVVLAYAVGAAVGKKKRLPLACLMLVPLLSGCLSSAPKPPTYWTIDFSRADAGASGSARGEATVRIAAVDVRAPYAGQRLVVLRSNGSLAYDSFNTFATAPAHLLRGAVQDAVDRSGKFARVVAIDSLAHTTYSMEVTVTQLALDCRKEDAHRARVELSVQLLRGREVVSCCSGVGACEVTGDYSGDFSAAFAHAMRQALDGIRLK